MKPRSKILVLLLVLIVPYMAAVLYFASRQPQQSLPTWLLYLGALYFVGSMVLAIISQRGPHDTAHDSARSQSASQWVRGRATGLVVLWSAFLLYGVHKTLRGDFPLKRALPAGAFLLAFIGLFSWLLYRDNQARQNVNR